MVVFILLLLVVSKVRSKRLNGWRGEGGKLGSGSLLWCIAPHLGLHQVSKTRYGLVLELHGFWYGGVSLCLAYLHWGKSAEVTDWASRGGK